MALGSLKKGSLLKGEAGGGTIPSATNTVEGKIRIATDAEVATGTAENLAVNPKQISDLKSDLTGATLNFSVSSGATDIITGVDLTGKTFDVFKNGLLQIEGATKDYTITTTENISTIVFNSAFSNDGVVVLRYGNVLAGEAVAPANIPFSIKSANIGDKGEVDLFNISKFVNSGCSFTGAVATGGSGKYVRLLEEIPLSTSDSWAINFPAYTHIIGANESSIFSIDGFLSLGITSANTNFIFALSSVYATWDIYKSWEDGAFILSPVENTTYYFKLTYDSVTGYELLYNTDGGTSYTSIKAISTTTKIPKTGQTLLFLNSLSALTTLFSIGKIDLSTGSIVIDGNTWWTANASNTLSFKVDAGTSYAPLTVINPDGTEITLTSISNLDLSSFTDGIINIFATATGAEARQNKIFVQTAEPTAENDGDIWINGDVIKDWDETGSVWVATTVIAFLGSIIKNGIIENGYSSPLNYNGKTEMSCINYVSGNIEVDMIAKKGFNFYGRYKNYLSGVGANAFYKFPTLFFAFYDNSYTGIYGGRLDNSSFAGNIMIETRDVFEVFSNYYDFANVIIEGYLTK